MFDIGTASLEIFTPHVGTVFSLEHPEQHENFTLVDAKALTSYDHPSKKRDPFSLFFKGSRTDLQFNQQILPLQHPALGLVEIFIVPIARNEDGTFRYQAVFN